MPGVLPALVTGFTLAFARALGEYGSVVFISGNLPFKTEIATLLIMTKLEQYDYAGATAIASVMLVVVVRPAPRHQRPAGVGAAARQRAAAGDGMSTRPGVTDPLWVRILLTALALLFLFGFLVIPLAAVFSQAFEKAGAPTWPRWRPRTRSRPCC